MKTRDSKFEFLRIIAMMMIVLTHLSSHGVMKVASQDALILWQGGTLVNKYFCCLMLPGGRVGVALFFMITGFFSINKDRIRVKNVVVETLFYAVVMSVISIVVKENSFVEVIKSPLAILNGDWWFVSSYIFLALCVPLINRYYKTLDIKKQALLLVGVWLMFYFLPYIFKTKYYDLIRCIPFYIAGAFLKSCLTSVENSTLFEKLKKWRWTFLVSFFVIWLIDSAVKFAYYQYDIRGAKGILLDGVIHNGILIPAAAILLFGYIILMDEFSNKHLNLIASRVFGVYLIHDSVLRYFIWDTIFRVPSQYQSVFFPLFAIGTGITVFGIALACSMVGAVIMKKLFHSIT